MGAVYDKMACCQPGPMPKNKGLNSTNYGSQNGSGKGNFSDHSIMRGAPTDPTAGPELKDFIIYPWLIAVGIVFLTIITAGSSWFWVTFPALVACLICGSEARIKARRKENSWAIFYALCLIAAFAAFVMSLIAFIHFLRPYHTMGGGATYLDMLPSQSAMGATDATAIVFAPGSFVDISRTYGYVDGRNPAGTIYCVAPVSNKWTVKEPGVQFFAAGINCCGKKSGFGCGQGGSGSRGALIIQREETADPGFKKAVTGAAVAYNIQPGNGYLLLDMVQDPITFRNDKWDGAVKLLLIYIFVYLVIACMTGYMAFNVAKR